MAENLGKYSVGVEVDYTGVNRGIQNAIAAMNESIARMTASINGMAKSIDESIQRAANSTRLATTEMAANISRSTSQVNESINKMKTVVGSIGIGVVASFGTATKAALDYEKSLLGLSRTTGLTFEAGSRMAYAANYSGVATEDLGRNLGILSRNLVNLEKNTDSATNVFNRFQIETLDANDKLLPTEQILMNIADRFKSMPNGVEKTGLSMQLFGRAGQQMIPMLNQGSDGLKKMGLTAEKLGLVFKDDSALKSYAAANKQWQYTLKGLELQLGQITLPLLTAVGKAVSSAMQAFNSIDPAIRQVGLTAAGTAGAIAAMSFGWGAATKALGAFGGPFASVAGQLGKLPSLTSLATTSVLSLGQVTVTAFTAMVHPVTTYNTLATASTSITLAMRAAFANTTAALQLLPAALAGGRAGLTAWAGACNISTIAANACRLATTALYATVGAGVVVIGALAAAWYFNVGGIKEATATFVETVSQSFHNLWESIKQMSAGMVDMFSGIWKVATGDLKGGVEQMKASLAVIGIAATGVRTAISNIGSGISGGIQVAGKRLWETGKKTLGFGDSTATPEIPEISPDFNVGGDDGKAAKEKKGDTEYEIQKRRYEQDVALHEYTLAEKLDLFQRYLTDVRKLEEEQLDYDKTRKQLEIDARKEKLEMERLDIETRLAEGKASEEELLKKKIEAAINALTAEREGTLEYKKLLKEKAEAEKSYFEWQYQQLQQCLEREKEHNNALIELEREKIRHLKSLGELTDTQSIQANSALDEEAYKKERARLEDLAQFKKRKFGEEADEYKEIKKQQDALEDQMNLKRLQNSNALKEAQVKNILEVKNTLASSISEAIQGAITRSKTAMEALKNIFSNVLKTMLKQLTDSYAANITRNMFSKQLLSPDAKQDKKRLLQESATQAGITAAAAAGNAQRLANDQATSQSQVGITQTKAATQTGIETAKDGAIMASATVTGATVVSSIQATIQSMMAMLPTLLLISAITGMMGGGGGSSTSESTGEGINLGRSPDSYYKTPPTIKVPSFDVGSIGIAKDMLAMVHKDEIIIPQPFADSARSFIQNGGFSGNNGNKPSGDIYVNYSAAHYGRTNKDVQGELKENARYLAGLLQKEARNFNYGKK